MVSFLGSGWFVMAAWVAIATLLAMGGVAVAAGSSGDSRSPEDLIQLDSHGVSQGKETRPFETVGQFEAVGQAQAGCSAELTDAVDQLMLALPNYANRVIQRQRVGQRDSDGIWRSESPRTYVALAGRPDIESLTASSSNAPLFQIFFTTLERQYVQSAAGLAEPQMVQQFHQLVLAQVGHPEGWRVIRLRSQLAPYPADNQLLSPPRNADNGAIAQAIRLWLRDCAAGTAQRG